MIDNLLDFSLYSAAGVIVLLCLFDGTRRLGAYGVHRRALLLTILSASACALFGGFAYQRYTDLKSTLATSQRKPAAAKPASFGKAASPEKKEQFSVALARQSFRASGDLGSYIDRNGEAKAFAPNQEDLKAREGVVAYYSRTEFAAR